MKNDKTNNIIIGLLVIIIIILFGLVILFATGTITFNNNSANVNELSGENNESTSENIESNESISNNILNDNQILESNKNIYSDVLDEYKNAILDKNKDNYNYVNENAIHHYFNQKGTNYEFNFEYSFYDINKDGKYEMLINNGIIDIFSYDGTKIIRLFKEDANCLAESRCSISLYDDGTIYYRGSGGASSSIIRFYSINKNTSTLNTINSYYLNYGDDGSLIVYDESTYDYVNNTGTKLDYSSGKELLTANIHNANEVDLNQLNWSKINQNN